MTNPELLQKFFDAENARDWIAFRGCLHPQVMWFLHTEMTHMPVAGREEYMDRIMSGYRTSDATFTCERMEVSPQRQPHRRLSAKQQRRPLRRHIRFRGRPYPLGIRISAGLTRLQQEVRHVVV